jgi:excinuclease ABC subunit C
VNYFKEELKQILYCWKIKRSGGKHVLTQLQKDLQLAELPVNIECFDNSNFQGSYPVSAMVSFKDTPQSDYRKFNVKL